MKTILTTLFILGSLICTSLFAAMTSVLIEEADGGARIDATMYGVLGNGVPKRISFKDNDVKLADDVENCDLFNLDRHVLRFWMFFDQSGKVSKIDFHMGETFESKIFNLRVQPQAVIAAQVIHSDPEDGTSPMIEDPAHPQHLDSADKARFDSDTEKLNQALTQIGKLKTLLESK